MNKRPKQKKKKKSADTLPISPTRFAEALKDLSLSNLHLKVLELRNSIAHLDYSNEQLRPFAEGTATALDSRGVAPAQPDPDCVDAIRENEEVIGRMQERIGLVRAEVESRGFSWTEFQSKEEAEAATEEAAAAAPTTNGEVVNETHPQESTRHSAWTDGTFQTGVIRDGQLQGDAVAGSASAGAASGGSLTDEELRRRMEQQLRNLSDDEGDGEGGLHL